MDAPNNLDEMLLQWREEQIHVSNQVIIPDDPTEVKTFSLGQKEYKAIPNDKHAERLYGGVDVSFPQKEEDPAVATYVVLRGSDIVYKDFESFHLKVPYVSSYLSFREIDPLERLVKKQLKTLPEFTPEAILVDGNGILHVRRAGIASFLGVRTGLKTIGVGKTLYCHDGLSYSLLDRVLEQGVRTLIAKCKSCPVFTESNKGLIIDGSYIGVASTDEIPALIEPASMAAMMPDLYQLCSGFSMRLRGKSGTVWGAALVGHGGKIGNKSQKSRRAGTKNPIIVSVGHRVSLEEAIQICCEVSNARCPEPVRVADLWGRELIRDSTKGAVPHQIFVK